jgi:hypothetical protein
LRLLPTLLPFAGLVASQATLQAQDTPFPIQAFWQNDSLARALLRYDACAWQATDTLLATLDSTSRARLGPEWFCMSLGDRWHAVFGRYDPDGDRYDVVAHFELDGSAVRPSMLGLDTTRVTSRARAAYTARHTLPAEIQRSRINFNTYVLADPDSSLSVWFLPGWQPSGVAVFGAEFCYKLDPTGRQVLAEHVINRPLRGTRPDSTVAFSIESDADTVPRVGDLFFYHLTRAYFRDMRIQTRHFWSSTVTTESGETWIHVARDR